MLRVGYECPVCLESFEKEGGRTPYVLGACGHSICCGCCARLKAGEGGLRCPSCAVRSGEANKNYSLIDAVGELWDVRLGSARLPECTVCGQGARERCASCTGDEPLYVCCTACFEKSHRYLKGHKRIPWNDPTAHAPQQVAYGLELFNDQEHTDILNETRILLLAVQDEAAVYLRRADSVSQRAANGGLAKDLKEKINKTFESLEMAVRDRKASLLKEVDELCNAERDMAEAEVGRLKEYIFDVQRCLQELGGVGDVPVDAGVVDAAHGIASAMPSQRATGRMTVMGADEAVVKAKCLLLAMKLASVRTKEDGSCDKAGKVFGSGFHRYSPKDTDGVRLRYGWQMTLSKVPFTVGDSQWCVEVDNIDGFVGVGFFTDEEKPKDNQFSDQGFYITWRCVIHHGQHIQDHKLPTAHALTPTTTTIRFKLNRKRETVKITWNSLDAGEHSHPGLHHAKVFPAVMTYNPISARWKA